MGNWARSTSWRNDWEWTSDLLQSLVVFLGLNNSVVRVFDVFSPCRVVFGDREAGGHDSIAGCGHSLKRLGQDSALPAWHTGGTTATQIDYNGLR